MQAASVPLQGYLMSRVLTLRTVTNPASCSLTSEHRAALRNLGRLTWICISVWPMLFACFLKKTPRHIFCYDQIQRVLFLGGWERKWHSYRGSWGGSQWMISPFYSLLCPPECRRDKKCARYRVWWFSVPRDSEWSGAVTACPTILR